MVRANVAIGLTQQIGNDRVYSKMYLLTSLYIISDAPKYDTIWTENSNVIDSFISEILKHKS